MEHNLLEELDEINEKLNTYQIGDDPFSSFDDETHEDVMYHTFEKFTYYIDKMNNFVELDYKHFDFETFNEKFQMLSDSDKNYIFNNILYPKILFINDNYFSFNVEDIINYMNTPDRWAFGLKLIYVLMDVIPNLLYDYYRMCLNRTKSVSKLLDEISDDNTFFKESYIQFINTKINLFKSLSGLSENKEFKIEITPDKKILLEDEIITVRILSNIVNLTDLPTFNKSLKKIINYFYET